MNANDSKSRAELSSRLPELPDPTEVSGSEFEKSRVTRRTILEAAIECLATIGYVATSTTTVAKFAGLARTAMLYHFKNRLTLIEAVIHYVTRKRVAMQEEAHLEIPRDEFFQYMSIECHW